jgi:NADPH:quinone reductase-like Zn-dependent oxidoreductase
VIAVDRLPPPSDTPAQAMPDAFVSADAPNMVDAVREATGGHGGDVVFNTVSGAAFNQQLKMLARHGRMVVIASVGSRDVSFDMLDFYHNESRLIGVDSRALDTVASGVILDKIAPGFESGALAGPLIAVRYALDQGVDAYAAVDRGDVRGKAVLAP